MKYFAILLNFRIGAGRIDEVRLKVENFCQRMFEKLGLVLATKMLGLCMVLVYLNLQIEEKMNS